MSRNYLFTTTFILASYCLSCQIDTSTYLSIGIGPSGLLDPITPSLNIVLEKSVGEKLNLELTYGLDLLNKTWADWHPNGDARHHEYKIGIKSISKPLSFFTNSNFFAGLEYYGVINNYERPRGSYFIDDNKFSYISAQVNRTIQGLRMKLGSKFSYNAIELEFYGGLGLRSINIEYSSIVGRRAGHIEFFKDFFIVDEYEGRRIRPELNFGFKISYCIHKS